VDKFQGQEAKVVLYSLASSSGEDVPRGLEFLLSRNRLNVAISRAQCLAYLVCSPRLLEVDCKTIPHMRLANALCRFVELAESRGASCGDTTTALGCDRRG
jgi:ATP-dependent exoDNAse (exonuclease V) alpha subunit